MKTLLSILVLSLSITCFSQQERIKPIYFDINFGLMPTGDDIMHGFNLSGGYQFNKYYALGLSRNSGGIFRLYEKRSLSGIGLENRFSFRHFLVKLNGGLVTGAQYEDGEWCEGDFNSNSNFYFRTGLEYHFHIFSFGLTGIYAPNLSFNLHDYEGNSPGSCLSVENYQIPKHSSIYFAITFGFSFPKLVKHWKPDN